MLLYCIHMICMECWNEPYLSATVRTVHNYEHFQLWKFCSIMCSSCEVWIEGSVNVIIISCSLQLLTKDPYERLGAYGQLDRVREQPFFRVIDWRALQEKRVKPPQKPKIVKVSNTDSVFISCHMQFLLTLHVNYGNNSFMSSTSFI
jgi:hypothetical protein